VITGKECTRLRRIFFRRQGTKTAHSELCNCFYNPAYGQKDKQTAVFFDRNHLIIRHLSIPFNFSRTNMKKLLDTICFEFILVCINLMQKE